MHTHLTSGERWFLIAIFTCAIAFRIVYILEIQNNPFFEHPRLDALFHDKWATTIASGELVGDKVFFRAPAYPYFLGMLYATFGHNYVVPRIVQHVLGALGLLALYFLARRMFGIRTAILASTLALFNPILMYFEGELLFDSLLALMCLVWLVVVERCKERPSFVRWLFVGFVFGIICCIRPLFLVIAPCVFVSLARRYFTPSSTGREGVRVLFTIALGCILPIVPITIRNYTVGHDFVLIAYQGGLNFYIGNNPEADGHSSMMPGPRGASWENRDQTYLVEKALGHPPSPSEESGFWYRKGIQFIVEHPMQYLYLLTKKAYLFWNWYEIPNNQNFYSFREYSTLLKVLPIGFWMVGPMGMLGMAMALQQRRGGLTILFITLYASVTILFFVCDRFRLPIVPLLSMFAGFALNSLFEIAQRKEWKQLLSAGVIGACSALLVNSNLFGIEKNTRARDFLALGIVELNKGNYLDAITNFEQSMEDNNPPRPNLFLNWGVAELGLGHTDRAVAKFTEELLRYPDSYGALNNLSHLYLSLGRMDSAIYFGQLAVRAKPYLPNAYIPVAQAYRNQRDLEKAASVLEQGMRACGETFMSGKLLLAGTYKELGRIDAAEPLYRRVLTQSVNPTQPSYEPDLDFVEGDLAGENKSYLRAEAMYGLGHIWTVRMNLDSSLSYFRKAVVTWPDYADAWADLGVALMQARRYNDADSALNRAISLQPQNHLYWYNYGTLLGRLGRLSEAEKAFERALSIRPDFEPARQKAELSRRLLKREGSLR
jgi:tetratricopeptide (TPR) repeat protein